MPATLAPPAESTRVRADRILSGDIHPDDYLPVTDRVRFLTDREMEYARARLGTVEPNPSVERRQLRQNLLLVHHPEEHVGYLEDDAGVIVLVTGLGEIERFLREVPYEDRKAVGVEYVSEHW